MAGGDSKKSSHDNSDQPNKDVSVSKDLASIRREEQMTKEKISNSSRRLRFNPRFCLWSAFCTSPIFHELWRVWGFNLDGSRCKPNPTR